VGYAFKAVNGVTRISATKKFGGIPLHFEVLTIGGIFAPKVSEGFYLNLLVKKDTSIVFYYKYTDGGWEE